MLMICSSYTIYSKNILHIPITTASIRSISYIQWLTRVRRTLQTRCFRMETIKVQPRIPRRGAGTCALCHSAIFNHSAPSSVHETNTANVTTVVDTVTVPATAPPVHWISLFQAIQFLFLVHWHSVWGWIKAKYVYKVNLRWPGSACENGWPFDNAQWLQQLTNHAITN